MLDHTHKHLTIDTSLSSPNANQRISSLVLHYTALSFEKSLKAFNNPKRPVSAHYLIPEMNRNGGSELEVFQLVPENKRAWHAGSGSWQNKVNLNDTSIGIEIVNLGFSDKKDKRYWHPFTEYQIEALIELTKSIVTRYQIHPTCVIGHSDLAPGRKVDPGPLFPWKTLYDNGVGAWFDEEELGYDPKAKINILRLQKNLRSYGYAIEITGKLNMQTRTILQAFQMHFRPENYSGKPDAETCAILENLLKKYFPS